jgi:putative membrane protein
MMWGYDPGWGGWLMMVSGNILWIALLGVLVWAVVRRIEQRQSIFGSPGPRSSAHEPSALEILSQRYARGEIDTATFEQMRERLQAIDSRRSPSEDRLQPTRDVR